MKESKYSEIWNERLEQLKEYKAQNGHCNVSTIDEGNKALGGWVNKQRVQYTLMLEGAKSHMTQEKVRKLESIGFEWRLRKKRSAGKSATVKKHSKKSTASKNPTVKRSSKKRVASKNTTVKRRSKRVRSRK